MIEKIRKIYVNVNGEVQMRIHLGIYELLIAVGCVLVAIAMLYRVFYGTEITDEAYWVSDAMAMVQGNIPYAYNNYSYGTGSAFLLIPIVFLYGLAVPDNEGVFLFTRICFMLFWYIVLLSGCRILKKDFKKSSVLLVLGFMIPYAGDAALFNFSYNTIPCALAYISGLIIYDAIEHKNKYSAVKLVLAGFLLGIAVLAHPGYGIAVVVLGSVVLIRSDGVKEKFYNLLCCLAGGISEMLVVFIPVILQAGPQTLLAGIRNKLHPYPTGKMYEGTTETKLNAVIGMYGHYIPYILTIFGVIFLLFTIYNRKKSGRLSKKEYTLLSVSAVILYLTVSLCRLQIGADYDNFNWQLGFIGTIGIASLFLFLEFRQHPLLLYMGIYPVLFAFAQIVAIDSNASTGRLVSAVPALGVYFLVMLNRKSRLTRIMSAISVVICIMAMEINAYRYVYRDEHIDRLNHKVESGVYKGIYTTKARSNDLPELEEYLNDIVGEDVYYAFRDNVPAGYLMMHHGIMCDKDTWDCMNYTYHKSEGTPSNLYEFYQRRGAFPQIIIYVDYGRDENLSIEDEDYKFNEFVNVYYTKTADFKLNETFYHIMVYEYSGDFDGNFDYWIERHLYTEE